MTKIGLIVKIAIFIFQILWCDNGCGFFAGFDAVFWEKKRAMRCTVIAVFVKKQFVHLERHLTNFKHQITSQTLS